MAGVRIRALTTPRLTSLLQPAADPHGSLTSADAPLIKAGILFRQPEPPLRDFARFRRRLPIPSKLAGPPRNYDVIFIKAPRGEHRCPLRACRRCLASASGFSLFG